MNQYTLFNTGVSKYTLILYWCVKISDLAFQGAAEIFQYLTSALEYRYAWLYTSVKFPDSFNIVLWFFSPERIASAYELLGGTFLDEHHDSQKALQYWRAACDERERAGLSKQIQVEHQTTFSAVFYDPPGVSIIPFWGV